MENNKRNEWLRSLPPVHELQKTSEFAQLRKKYHVSEDRLTQFIQETLSEIRKNIMEGESSKLLDPGASLSRYIWKQAEAKVAEGQKNRLAYLINGTGTVLHTNLGRARLSEDAIRHAAAVAGNYSNLEYQMEAGKRGSRHDILEDLLVEITGAEAAMVVNNNAAAVYLVLRALAKDQEVIVSRGELIEIGGSFRVSSIMEESGASLVEIGTTNKTHLYDYENAINENTAMLLKVHTSNFKMSGFTESVDRETLAALSRRQEKVIFYEDLGSGSLFDFRARGIGDEPVVREVLKAGVDLVSFSGDKLLGGPQAGIIVGKKAYIDNLKKHQLARVLRVDKMTFAGLEKTLRAYMGEEERLYELPVIRDILKTPVVIKEQAEDFSNRLDEVRFSSFHVEIREDHSQIGGGTMPDVQLPTFTAVIRHDEWTAEQLAKALRTGESPVVARIKEDAVLIDFRTVTAQEMSQLLQAFTELA